MKIEFTKIKGGEPVYVDYVDGVLSSTDPAQQASIERWLEDHDEEAFVAKFSSWTNGYVTSKVVEEEIPAETE